MKANNLLQKKGYFARIAAKLFPVLYMEKRDRLSFPVYLLIQIWGPFYLHELNLIPTWISNHMHSKIWDGITYPFPNFTGSTVEAWNG